MCRAVHHLADNTLVYRILLWEVATNIGQYDFIGVGRTLRRDVGRIKFAPLVTNPVNGKPL